MKPLAVSLRAAPGLSSPAPMAQRLHWVRRSLEGSLGLARAVAGAGLVLALGTPAVGDVEGPVLVYSRYLGGAKVILPPAINSVYPASEEARGIAADAQGNTYVVGTTRSADFPLMGPLQPTRGGLADAFVAKLNARGELMYSTYLGGSGTDDAYAVAVDRDGCAYVTGRTDSPNFPLAGARQPVRRGTSDAFVAKIDPTGSVLLYSTYLGGGADDAAAGIAVDAQGAVVVVGNTSSTDFPVSAQAFATTSRGSADGFVAKLDPQGQALLFSTYLGGAGYETVAGVALDSQGDVFVAGSTDSRDFPTVAAVQSSVPAGSAATSTHVFVSHLTPSGSALVFSTYLAGTGSERAKGVAVDGEGNAYVAGETNSPDFPVGTSLPGVAPLQSARRGPADDAFIAKLSTTGTLVYSTYLGGSDSPPVYGATVFAGRESAGGIAVDAQGQAHIVGSTDAKRDFPTTVNAVQRRLRSVSAFDTTSFPAPPTDAFVSVISRDGERLIYSTYLGGEFEDHGYAIALDPAGGIHIAGDTFSRDVAVSSPPPARGGPPDAFIASLAPSTSERTLSIGDVRMPEGNSSYGPMTFHVTLSPPSDQTVTVGYRSLEDTATTTPRDFLDRQDYTDVSGTLTFAPGTSSQDIAVFVNGDVLIEPDETFSVSLHTATNAAVRRGQAIGTILADDAARTTERWSSFFAVDLRETPYVGDFDGDRRTDIITFTRDNPNAFGDVYVALSTGSTFGASLKWHDFFAIDAGEQVVIGDYDGDGKDDIATWLGTTTRQVYVARSTGTGMTAESVWLNTVGFDPSDVLAGDANGDGKKDLVLFARTRGKVYVALSTGSGFGPPTLWHDFFAVSTYERPRVADVNGDGRADIVTFASDSPTAFGDVYVALSTGTQFGDRQTSAKWHDFFAIRPSEVIRIGDLDADGRDDFFTFLPPPFGQCYTALSQGTGMGANVEWRELVVPLSADLPFTGDVNGDGKADVIVFAQSEGKVYVSLAP
jgi:hypothetical protein